MSKPNKKKARKHWMIFYLRPADLVELLAMSQDESLDLWADSLPPDIKVYDAEYHEDTDHFVAILESEFFDPIDALWKDGAWQGAFPRLIFSIREDEREGDEEGDPRDLDRPWQTYQDEATVERPRDARPRTPRNCKGVERADLHQYRLRLLTVKVDEISLVLGQLARGERPQLIADLPRGCEIVYLTYARPQRLYCLWLTHSDFPKLGVKFIDGTWDGLKEFVLEDERGLVANMSFRWRQGGIDFDGPMEVVG